MCQPGATSNSKRGVTQSFTIKLHNDAGARDAHVNFSKRLKLHLPTNGAFAQQSAQHDIHGDHPVIGRLPRLRNQVDRKMVGLRAVCTRPRVHAAVRAHVVSWRR